MSVKIINCQIEDCGTGISAPADAKLDVQGTSIKGCNLAIELRDPPSLLSSLGLAPDTPVPILREVLAFIGQGFADPGSIKAKTESAGLFKWLSAGADFTTLIGGLVSIAQSSQVQAVLAMLPK